MPEPRERDICLELAAAWCGEHFAMYDDWTLGTVASVLDESISPESQQRILGVKGILSKVAR